SLERDALGNFWVPGTRRTKLTGPPEYFDDNYLDDHIVQVSPSGKTLYSKSVTQILIENGLINRVNAQDIYLTDALHLNDIQPALKPGIGWKNGDLFISLRNLSMLLLFRPSENRLLWWTQDKMLSQHDVDILSDHQIGVFDNNRAKRSKGN